MFVLLGAALCVRAAAAQVVEYYPGSETWHQTGFAVGTAWEATVANQSSARARSSRACGPSCERILVASQTRT